jgi:hypothetical protein
MLFSTSRQNPSNYTDPEAKSLPKWLVIASAWASIVANVASIIQNIFSCFKM